MPTALAQGASGGKSRIDWKSVWPVPALLGATGMLVGGLVVGILRAPKSDPAAPLKEAAAFVEQAKFDEAIDILNTKIVPAMQKGALGKDKQIEFYVMRARALSEGQKQLNLSRAENYKAVVSDFGRAVELGYKLEPGDMFTIAEAHIALGETEKALEQSEKLPAADSERRMKLWTRIVETNLRGADVKYEMTLAVLSKILDQPKLGVEEKAWAIARQTELRLAMNFNEEAIGSVLRVWQRLEGVTKAQRGELLLLLGRAYFQLAEQEHGDVGAYLEATKQLELAMEDLDAADVRRGEAQYLIAKILQARGKIEEAKEAFAKVRAEHQNSTAQIPAMLGQAECQAALSEDDGAVKLFAELIDVLGKAEERKDINVGLVVRSLLERHADRYLRGDFQRALQYAQLAEHAWRGPEQKPAELLIALAQGHRKVAEQGLAEARGHKPGAEHGGGGAGGADPHGGAASASAHGATTAGGHKGASTAAHGVASVSASEAKRHFQEAGLAFREYSRAMVLTDNNAHLTALYDAADSFDLAADRSAAKEAFSAYVEGSRDEDRHRHESRYRLAQLFQSEQNYPAAEDLYRKLAGLKFALDEGKTVLVKDDAAVSSGDWGDRAVTPLARCMLQDSVPENDELAVQLLQEMVDGRRSDPRSDAYRDAITELGELHYLRGDQTKAISMLRRAEGYAEHPRIVPVKYKLADANRLSAAAIQADLSQALPVATRQDYEVTREQRLRIAAVKFQEVVEDLGARPSDLLTASQKIMLRNSMFYMGDCAFDLGHDYPAAIAFYDQAAQRYPEDPSSLVARTQIVAAYVAMGKWEEARRANELAKRQLNGIPESAMNDPDLPMQRKHWQRWFDADAALQKRAEPGSGGASADAGAGKPTP